MKKEQINQTTQPGAENKPVRKRIGKMNEAAWALGIILCAFGVCLITKAGFGLSMIAAPAYIIHRGMISIFPWYTQGTSEYIFQGVLLLLLCIGIQRFRLKYLLSFGTAVLFGLALDFFFGVFGGNGVYESMILRITVFTLGEIITGFAIAFFFRTNLPLQIYELVVTEVAKRFGFDNAKVKQVYDGASLLVSLLLALIVNRSWNGIGVGTVILTVVNAPLIRLCGKVLDRFFTFESAFFGKKTDRKES